MGRSWVALRAAELVDSPLLPPRRSQSIGVPPQADSISSAEMPSIEIRVGVMRASFKLSGLVPERDFTIPGYSLPKPSTSGTKRTGRNSS